VDPAVDPAVDPVVDPVVDPEAALGIGDDEARHQGRVQPAPEECRHPRPPQEEEAALEPEGHQLTDLADLPRG
jgi:hypothetical protein